MQNEGNQTCAKKRRDEVARQHQQKFWSERTQTTSVAMEKEVSLFADRVHSFRF